MYHTLQLRPLEYDNMETWADISEHQVRLLKNIHNLNFPPVHSDFNAKKKFFTFKLNELMEED